MGATSAIHSRLLRERVGTARRRHRGAAIVYIYTYLELVMAMSDRIAVMYNCGDFERTNRHN